MTASAPVLAKRQLVEPDYWTCPHGVRVRPEPALTYGPEVADLCATAGYSPDPQQELGLDLIFAIRPDGSPASFAFCVVCARQNLKSGLFQQCVIGWLFVLDVPEIAWSAHELRTSLNAQTELYATLQSPALSKYLIPTGNQGLYDANGKERIELRTDQTVWFQTRTRDGGRGLGKPKVIIDEAFKFKARVSGALLPILLAQHHPQLLYGSSAPPYDPDAEVLRDVMDRGRNHKSPELSYLEWLASKEPCADPDCTHPKDALARGIDCALDREHLLQQANPTLTTGRITMRTLRALRQELLPREYMRECLGWPEEPDEAAGPPDLDSAKWRDLAAKKAPPPTKVAVVLDVEPDNSAGTLGLVGLGSDGVPLMLVEVVEDPAELVDALVALRDNLGKDGLLEVALHPSSQAGQLMPDLKAADFEVHPLVHQDFGRGAATLQTAVKTEGVHHVGQLALDAAAGVARIHNGKWARAGSVPMGPVVAGSVALHRWKVLTAKPKQPPPPPVKSRATRSRADDIALVGF